MKVFFRGFNLYGQCFSDQKVLEEFVEVKFFNLKNLFINCYYSLMLHEDKLVYRGFGEGVEIKLNNVAVDHLSSNDEKILLISNGKLLKIEVNELKRMVELKLQLNDDDELVKVCSGSKLHVAYSRAGALFNIPNRLAFVNQNIVDIKCGREHCVLLDEDGNIYSFGGGSRGQLGHGSLENQEEPILVEALAGIKIIAVDCGGWHTCAVSRDGDLYVWGWNVNGQLGFNKENFSVLATPKLIDFEDDRSVKNVVCGARHTIIIMDNNKLYGAGSNKYKQLSSENIEELFQFTYLHDFSLVQDITVKCGSWNTIVMIDSEN